MHPLSGLLLNTIHHRPTSVLREIIVYFWVCILFCCFPATILSAQEKTIAQLHPFIDHGGYALQIDGEIVRSYNIDTSFIPASTIKILTGLIALEILGPQYRFATHFYMDSDKNLFIKGEGDPFLVSETIAKIADQLKKLNIEEINTLFLDDSSFALEGPPGGSGNSDNPYDAHSGGLVVNFNALPFQVLRDGSIASSEKQTPLLPIMNDIGRNYNKGRHRINVSAFPEEKDYSNILRYTGELFTAIFKSRQIRIHKDFAVAQPPPDAIEILTYESDKTVADLVQASLLYSSNFIANQLYLSSGRRLLGTPATWEKSRLMAQKFITLRLQLQDNVIRMVDGSGLSTNNRISPAAMLTVLNRFQPNAELLKQKGDIFLKSGTFTGAYCYAGYFQKEKKLAPFILFLNQKRNTRKKILSLLQHEFLKITPQ